jgi:hypothetical protein
MYQRRKIGFMGSFGVTIAFRWAFLGLRHKLRIQLVSIHIVLKRLIHAYAVPSSLHFR